MNAVNPADKRLSKREKQMLAVKTPNEIFWFFKERFHFKHGWKNYLRIVNNIDPTKLEPLLKSGDWRTFHNELYKAVIATLNDMAAAEYAKLQNEINEGKL